MSVRTVLVMLLSVSFLVQLCGAQEVTPNYEYEADYGDVPCETDADCTVPRETCQEFTSDIPNSKSPYSICFPEF